MYAVVYVTAGCILKRFVGELIRYFYRQTCFDISYSLIPVTRVVSVTRNRADESGYSVWPPQIRFQFSRVVIFSVALMESRHVMFRQKGTDEACYGNTSAFTSSTE